MPPRIVNSMLVVGAAIMVAACGSDSGGSSDKGGTGVTTGALTVTISTPGGVTGSVTISGPSGYSKTLSATTTLTGLTPGSYALTSTSVVSAATIVSVLDSGVISTTPVTVSTGDTATTSVVYAQRPGTGALWVTNVASASVLDAYAASSLSQSGSPSPSASIGGGFLGTISTGLAFDSHGNAWVAEVQGDSIIEYSAAQLGSASPTPVATILLPSPGATLAFDASGDLWVVITNDGISSVAVEFSASQVNALPARSDPQPVQVVTIPSPSSGGDAFGIAFDASGNMWVAQQTTGQVYRFAAGDLAGGTSGAVPTDSLPASHPIGLAFDAAGNLWVAGQTELDGFTAAQLTGPPPLGPIYEDTFSGSTQPLGLAFDNSGNLWMTVNTLQIFAFTPAQLTTGGQLTPTTTLTVSDGGAPQIGVIAFDPHGTGTPLAGARAPRSAR
jgi:sugar lactone lactonase YvrE